MKANWAQHKIILEKLSSQQIIDKALLNMDERNACQWPSPLFQDRNYQTSILTNREIQEGTKGLGEEQPDRQPGTGLSESQGLKGNHLEEGYGVLGQEIEPPFGGQESHVSSTTWRDG
jgi:hypothetical protein